MISDERRDDFTQQLVRTFRRYARFYDLIEWVLPLLPNNPRTLVARTVDADAETILDACTGNGAVLAALARSHPGARVYGLDLSPDMLALARRRIGRAGLSNAQILEGDCTKMPFDDGTFDAVTKSYGLHEMPEDVRRAAVAEAFRVLKPGGMLIVIDWDQASGFFQRVVAFFRKRVEPGWIAELFGDGLPELVRGAGFTNLTVRGDVFLSQMVSGTKRD